MVFAYYTVLLPENHNLNSHPRENINIYPVFRSLKLIKFLQALSQKRDGNVQNATTAEQNVP
jgi:hypothetical protein